MTDGQRVKYGTPLVSKRDHRMAFIFSDRQNFTPCVIMHVPYLHEKKLYLNRQKISTSYFYTSISTPIDQCRDHEMFQTSDGSDKKELTCILAVNLTESKQYSYTQNGILINRHQFDKEIANYGPITSTSNSGLCYICKKSFAQIQDGDHAKKFGEINLAVMSMFGFRYVKTIDLFEKYRNISQKMNIHTWLDDAI